MYTSKNPNTDAQWEERLEEVLASQFDGHPRPDWSRELTEGEQRMSERAYIDAERSFKSSALAMYVQDAEEMDRVYSATGRHPWQLKPLLAWAMARAKGESKAVGPDDLSGLLTRAMRYLLPLLRSYISSKRDLSIFEDFKRRLAASSNDQVEGDLSMGRRTDPVVLAQEMTQIFEEVRRLRRPLPPDLRVT